MISLPARVIVLAAVAGLGYFGYYFNLRYGTVVLARIGALNGFGEDCPPEVDTESLGLFGLARGSPLSQMFPEGSVLLEDFWPPPPVVLPTDPYLMLRPDESYSVSFDPPLEEGFQLGAIWSPATQDTALTYAFSNGGLTIRVQDAGLDAISVQIAEHDFKCWLPGGLHNHWNFVRMTFRTPAELKTAFSNLGGGDVAAALGDGWQVSVHIDPQTGFFAPCGSANTGKLEPLASLDISTVGMLDFITAKSGAFDMTKVTTTTTGRSVAIVSAGGATTKRLARTSTREELVRVVAEPNRIMVLEGRESAVTGTELAVRYGSRANCSRAQDPDLCARLYGAEQEADALAAAAAAGGSLAAPMKHYHFHEAVAKEQALLLEDDFWPGPGVLGADPHLELQKDGHSETYSLALRPDGPNTSVAVGTSWWPADGTSELELRFGDVAVTFGPGVVHVGDSGAPCAVEPSQWNLVRVRLADWAGPGARVEAWANGKACTGVSARASPRSVVLRTRGMLDFLAVQGAAAAEGTTTGRAVVAFGQASYTTPQRMETARRIDDPANPLPPARDDELLSAVELPEMDHLTRGVLPGPAVEVSAREGVAKISTPGIRSL